MSEAEHRKAYWRSNLTYLTILLTLWALLSLVLPVLLVDQLDHFRVGGFKLGFWIAQQGSMYGFLVIIVLYVFLMNRLDRKHDVQED